MSLFDQDSDNLDPNTASVPFVRRRKLADVATMIRNAATADAPPDVSSVDTAPEPDWLALRSPQVKGKLLAALIQGALDGA